MTLDAATKKKKVYITKNKRLLLEAVKKEEVLEVKKNDKKDGNN